MNTMDNMQIRDWMGVMVVIGISTAIVLSFVLSNSLYARAESMAGTWMFKGVVTEVNRNKLEMFGTNGNGVEVRPKFDITPWTKVKGGVLLFDVPDEVRWNVTNEIQRGSSVTVWATTSGHALVIWNNAPAGQADYYGQVDCSHCAQ